MDDPFTILGLSPDADPQEIRKAYARLIKVHRPDRDPAAFQRIHRAYEAALAGDNLDDDDTAIVAPAVADLHDALEERFTALYDHGDHRRLLAAVSSPTLLADAVDHPAVAGPVLLAVAALVWRTAEVLPIHARLRALPASHGLEDLIDLVDSEVSLASRFFDLQQRGALDVGRGSLRRGVPAPLVRVLAGLALATPARRARTLADAAHLLADPWHLLDFCDRLAPADPPLALALAERLASELPSRPPALADALTARLDLVVPAPWYTRARHSRVAALLVGMMNHSLLARLEGWTEEDGIPGIPKDYTDRLRPTIARTMLDLGVPVPAVRDWILERHGRDRYAVFVGQLLADDPGLILFGVLVALLKPRGSPHFD